MIEAAAVVFGFIVGMLLGVLNFELFSVKHPKTREEALMLLELLPPETKREKDKICEPEIWMDSPLSIGRRP